MQLILKKDDGAEEKIDHFIVISFPVNHPPFIGNVISNIDEFYVPYLLSDHGRWELDKRMK